MVKVKIGDFPQAEDIWNFINYKLGYSYSYPKIHFCILKKHEWKKLLNSKNVQRLQQNNFEIEFWKNREWRNNADATYMRNDKNDYSIILLRHPKNIMSKSLKRKGLSILDYYHLRILHEFLHILELITKTQIIKDINGIDLELFILWKSQIKIV